MGELTDKDAERIIRLLSVAKTYPESLHSFVVEEFDTPDYDVLRWESEGGSPLHRS